MDSCRGIILLSLLLIYSGNNFTSAQAVWSLIRDFIQHNVAGAPVVHEQTEWNFDPEIGKQRSVRYEAENGRRGENAIAKIGMGIGYNGSWGTSIKQ